MLRSVAYVHHFVDSSHAPKKSESMKTVGVTSAEIQKAERILWLIAQSEAFQEKVTILKQNLQKNCARQEQVKTGSSLLKQFPFVDEYGVVYYE